LPKKVYELAFYSSKSFFYGVDFKMTGYKFLASEKISGKTIAIRVDLNSNVEDNELFEGPRIERYSASLKKLSEQGAKLVVLAHQGRKGEEDFVSLKQHAQALSENIGKPVSLLAWDSDFAESIKAMQPGDIILMENVRFHDNEEQTFSAEEASKIDWVQKIASVSGLFVQDALSVCHRSQPSVVGFPGILPSFVGPVLEQELNALKQFDKGEKPCVFVLGGAKVKDSIALINFLFEKGKACTVCVAGLLGEIFLKASGKELGQKDKFLEEENLNQFVDQAKSLLSQHPEKILLPVDVAIMNDDDEREQVSVSELPKDNMIYDIGTETVLEFKAALKGAKLVVVNGPMGVFEKMDFEIGTKKVLDAVSKSRAFSLIGGGATVAALEQADFSHNQFSHVSLAGKALLHYFGGKELPGLVALQK